MDHDQERELEALEGILSDPGAEPIMLSYGLLKFITAKFSSEIGRGGFGVVYQGDLRNGVVAVKRCNGHNVTNKQFIDEIRCLKSANHKNIVRFLGYCADKQEEVMPLDGAFVMSGERNRFLCFEYVSNGNIRQYLEQEKSHRDDWPTRYQMIRGICEGLQHLHDKQINHLDLKPENVMLDADMEAKITDFGISRFLDTGKSRIITEHIYGTLRYIAPEVIDKRELSFKADIYALGIIIIDLLTGSTMTSLANWEESLGLLDCPRARLCAEIARDCSDAKRDNRPTIHEVIRRMDELESMIPNSSTNQLVTATAFPGTELLDVYPLELRFLFDPEVDSMSCSLSMINKTNGGAYCMLVPKDADSCSHRLRYEYTLPPLCTSVVTVQMDVTEEELPSHIVEWQVVMFTTSRCDEEAFGENMPTVSRDVGTPFEDAIKARQEFFGGEMHRAALTASVVVGSEEDPMEGIQFSEFTIVPEEEYFRVHSIDMHPTEPWVLLISDDTVYTWDWNTNEKVGEYTSPAGLREKDIRDDHDPVAKFIAREQLVIIGNKKGFITVHTCPTLTQVNEFQAHSDCVNSLAVHPTRPFLLSFSPPLSLKLWDWSYDWSCTTTFAVRSPLRQVMFNPKDTTTFATRDRDGLLQTWRNVHPNPITTTRCQDDIDMFSYTGHQDFAAVIDSGIEVQTISIWDLRKEKQVYTLFTPEYTYEKVVCHPTRPIFLTTSTSGHIQVWDSTTYRLKMSYDKLEGDSIHVGFIGSTRLMIGCREGIAVMDIDLE